MQPNYKMPNMGGTIISDKIRTQLMKEMMEGEYSSSIRLPSEVELANKFKISRSVIRDALSVLEREGFIERTRGVGTIIHRNVLNIKNRMDIKHEYFDLVLKMGKKPRTEKVFFHEEQANEKIAKVLQIKQGDTLLVCKKCILADEIPVIYSIDYLPKELFSKVNYAFFNWGLSIFEILEKELGIHVDTDITTIFATNATSEIKQILKTKKDDALLLMEEIGYYKLSFPVLYSYGYYTNFFDFSLLRKRV